MTATRHKGAAVRRSARKEPDSSHDAAESRRDDAARERILDAAMAAFMERGYGETSTLEIATRAKVSKRALYAFFGSKEAMLETCIRERVERVRLPSDLPVARDRDELGRLLTTFGTMFLREICRPEVMAVFRLAITEAQRSPQVARTLNVAGREASRNALREILARAQSQGLIGAGDLAEPVQQFFALLWGDLILTLLLRVGRMPDSREISRRAESAATAFLRLNGGPASLPEPPSR